MNPFQKLLNEFITAKDMTIYALAKISGVEERLGSLKEEKDADIVIYEGSPLEIKGNALITIIDGKIVWRKDNPQYK